jgi:hypothetical protein
MSAAAHASGVNGEDRILGELSGAVQISRPWLAAHRAPDPARVESLARLLYASWYAGGGAKRADTADGGPPLVEALRASHAGSWRFENGWTAVRVSSAGRVVARRGQVERLLTVTDYASQERPGLAPRVGDRLLVVERIDDLLSLPGFWSTHSPDWISDPRQVLRVYFNVQPAGAPELVWQVTRRLAGRLPFCLKLPSSAPGFARRDAAVLYLDCEHFAQAREPLAASIAALAGWLDAETPPLTRKLAPGVGAAESPPGRESFGQRRCRLVAGALAAAADAGEAELAPLLQAIRERFAAHGVPPERPWLERRSDHDYDL